uniref:uncharacterized protein LOC105351868 n=1 Tax=Fragaria vesca subsp. vesca TaxID=101020 RepID=UPI0005CA2A19|nr:PREDICTED: uncharacterized protein LOC105351868 [Fragaria vesca subsp. vesca]
MGLEGAIDLPWICVGDFNEFNWPHEKRRRRSLSLIINTEPSSEKGLKPYKFKPSWIEDTECTNIVNEAWSDQNYGNFSSQWAANLHHYSNALGKWSKKFSNNRRKINCNIEELQMIQANSIPEKHDRARSLTDEIAQLWDNEEKYWAQRSRIKWLKTGDSNSRFFHLTTVHRRKRNKVLKLKTNNNI